MRFVGDNQKFTKDMFGIRYEYSGNKTRKKVRYRVRCESCGYQWETLSAAGGANVVIIGRKFAANSSEPHYCEMCFAWSNGRDFGGVKSLWRLREAA